MRSALSSKLRARAQASGSKLGLPTRLIPSFGCQLHRYQFQQNTQYSHLQSCCESRSPLQRLPTVMAAVAGPVSPSSSPRLPSPPPFPEVQIGPKSPTVGGPSGSMAAQEFEDAAKHDTGAMRRIRPGTKAADMASGPPLVPLSEVSVTLPSRIERGVAGVDAC